ncbi:putative component of membrane protein insertase Oxa1/YidC/SpoIIIJ protein YidD [Aquimarina sp. EL_43]|uniref:membrane protein insertion efficiency factor YidD n=1 Tax=unclassified Aquimarina TaxID=2627091 RepID=UPI0018CAD842|nr:MULTISPECIES: membrane protein insertion efficiency factor YidD [unclassified Aquimarina]MBG6131755.1 putative component of membrane protein insertase Oxa1/YidC/SpoIIIJ protein YidD [Aquimarina sp. EL_35]MBG6149319.1 putative component of membrane protein insertase Oxa1/YidC/SpoIIIJ protein YidD [Aquimarina sp. EL_32]MBG6170418.1 putative component of membrane protein insertase Oxa1/YidC/SpoIIIJ protein YidD [Aquimarina sp. EL_43]
MKFFLLLIIRLYWTFIPKSNRRRCIFKKSCSNHVFEITKKQGFNKGISALKFRYRNCRTGYYILDIDNTKLLISANNEMFLQEEIHNRILTKLDTDE